jgi:hypothetical protein
MMKAFQHTTKELTILAYISKTLEKYLKEFKVTYYNKIFFF